MGHASFNAFCPHWFQCHQYLGGRYSLIKCHPFPFIEMQGSSTVKAVLLLFSELPDTFLLYLCTWDSPSLFQLMYIFLIFRVLSPFLLFYVRHQVLGLVEEEGERGVGAAHLPSRNISPRNRNISYWFQVISALWKASTPQHGGSCYNPAPQVQNEWNLINKYVSFISAFDGLSSSVSNIFLQSHLLYSLLDFWIFAWWPYSS